MFGIDDMIMGGIGLAGGVVNNLMAGERQEEAQKFNAAEAEKNREYQTQMSNTAYQRGMADMKQAGLNPILAYQKGPASSPTGATASTSAAPVHDIVGPALSTAMQSRRLNAEVANMVETNENLKATRNLIGAQTAQAAAGTANTVADTQLKNAALSTALRDAHRAQTGDAWLDTPGGRIIQTIGGVARELNPFVSSAGKVNRIYVGPNRD